MSPIDQSLKYLVFDVETTGLPKSWKAPFTNVSNWPRIVQIAWLSFDAQGNLLESTAHIIKPDGFNIPQSSEKIHGISTAHANENGKAIKPVLADFSVQLEATTFAVAHNLNFDENVIRAELLRAKLDDPFDTISRICTKEQGKPVCKIPGKYGYKWPRLDELYNHLFEESFKDAHNALNDARATAECFFELKRRQAIS